MTIPPPLNDESAKRKDPGIITTLDPMEIFEHAYAYEPGRNSELFPNSLNLFLHKEFIEDLKKSIQ